MKVAIHHRQGSFSERWINYCKNNSIDYKIVNAFDNNIIAQLGDCDILMWHYHHGIFEDVIAARKILFSLEHAGIKVFPNFNTGWHFDDKVAQKYLFEVIKAPVIPSYVFYDKKNALDWAKKTSYPKVFKLKGGAGSANVKLVKTKVEAFKLINKSFGKGFPQFDSVNNFKERYKKFKSGQSTLFSVIKSTGRFVIPTKYSKQQSPEKGYVYFQDFIPNEGFDVRVVVVGDKAVALKRLVRENDFRASGSGNLVFENENIDKRFIEIAFDINKKINSQSLAIDLIRSKQDEVLVVEISYGFPMINFLDGASGYWDDKLNWYQDNFDLQEWMIKNIINS